VSIHAFTGTQASIVTGAKVRSILGEEVADRVGRRFEQRRPDGNGIVLIDLGEDELAVIAALREISPDAADSDEQQATETLLKRLTGGRDGRA
jgi:hypothetical protein